MDYYTRAANDDCIKGGSRNRTKYTYDGNGNAATRNGSTVSWTSYNYPSSITAVDSSGTEQVQFSYGPDRQRWQQNYNSGAETTDYIGGLMEQVFSGGITTYRHYVYAGNEPVAVYSRTSTLVNTWDYFLTDHQGSIAGITNSTGTSVVGESFTAYGARRSPTTWSGAPSSGDLTTIAGISREGYTFQTALGQAMGLNHMNGRVQDAITGRFLSPDPIIQDPSNAQDYNRYAYVNNNPVTNIDPSGFVTICTQNATDYSDCLQEVVITAAPLVPGTDEITITAPQLPPASDPLPSLPGPTGNGPSGGGGGNGAPLQEITVTAPAQGNRSAVCAAANVLIGGLSGAAGGAVTGGTLGGLFGSGIGAGVGFALGVAGALIPHGGFGGGLAGALISLVAHTASGTSLSGFTGVLTDTAAGAAGDNPAAAIGISTGGTAAGEALGAAAGDVGAAAAEGGVAGGAGAVTSAVTNAALTGLARGAGCP